jgi:glycosyltransferase involved in cell wall biosynthesis
MGENVNPKFSVIIPLYNKGPHIKRALDSVLNQTIQDFEVIVVDGGSTDEGIKIVTDYSDCRIHLFHQEGTGVSDARNQGIHESRSNLIAFLDADDEWMPTFLETILKLIKKAPSAGLYSTAYKHESGKICGKFSQLSELRKLVPTDGLLPNYFEIAKKEYYIFFTSSVVVPKCVLIELNGFQVDYWWGEDVDMWGRIALKYPIAYCMKVEAIYYQNVVNSAYKRKNPVASHPFVDSGRKSLISGDLPTSIVDDLKEYIEYQEVFTARHNMWCGDKDLALRILLRKNLKLVNRKKLIRTLLSSTIKNNFSFL